MILNVEDDEANNVRAITIAGPDFMEKIHYLPMNEPTNYFVFDKIM